MYTIGYGEVSFCLRRRNNVAVALPDTAGTTVRREQRHPFRMIVSVATAHIRIAARLSSKNPPVRDTSL
jgi:hypothetical protein